MLDNTAWGEREGEKTNSLSRGVWGVWWVSDVSRRSHGLPAAAAARRVSLNERICAAVARPEKEGEGVGGVQIPPTTLHPAILLTPSRNVRSRTFDFFISPIKNPPKNRSLNKLDRAIVAAAGDSLKLSAPTLQEIKFMKSVLKAAQRSPKAKVELDKRGIVLICVQGEEKKEESNRKEQLEQRTGL